MPEGAPLDNVQLTRLLGRFWTAANALSLIRLILSVPVAYLILVDGPLTWIFGLVALGIVTDWFDGRIARWSKTVSEWGKVLDPLADKVAAAVIVMALVIRGSLPAWLLALILGRDTLIVLGGILITRRTGQVLMSVWMGKVAVTALSVTVVAALLKADEPVMQICIGATVALMVYSFVLYLRRALRVWHHGDEAPEATFY